MLVACEIKKERKEKMALKNSAIKLLTEEINRLKGKNQDLTDTVSLLDRELEKERKDGRVNKVKAIRYDVLVENTQKALELRDRQVVGMKTQLKIMHSLKIQIRLLKGEIVQLRQALAASYNNYANLCETYEDTQKDNMRLADSYIELEKELKEMSIDNGRLKAYDSLLKSTHENKQGEQP